MSGVRVNSIQRSSARSRAGSAFSARSHSSRRAEFCRIASRSQRRCTFSSSAGSAGKDESARRNKSIVRPAASSAASARLAERSGPQSCRTGSTRRSSKALFQIFPRRSSSALWEVVISAVSRTGSTTLTSRGSSCATPVRKNRIRSSICNRLATSGPFSIVSIIRQWRSGPRGASASQCASEKVASARPNEGHGFPPEPAAAAHCAAKAPSSSIPAQRSTTWRSKPERRNIPQRVSSAGEVSQSLGISPRSRARSAPNSAIRARWFARAKSFSSLAMFIR